MEGSSLFSAEWSEAGFVLTLSYLCAWTFNGLPQTVISVNRP